MFTPKRFNFGQAFLFILITSSGALAQSGPPPAQRTDVYNTPCTMNGLASWCAYTMRDAITGQLWAQKDLGFTSLIEQGGFDNTICVGPGSRLAYARGCAQP